MALLLDALAGEPPTPLHPVGWMGRAIDAGRRSRTTRDPLPSLLQGAGLVLGGALLAGGAAHAVERALRRVPTPLRAAVRGAALKPALSLRALLAAAVAVEAALRSGDLPRARRLLGRHLVSRDATELRPAEVAGAAIESLAENLGDGLVAPLLAWRAGGLGGAYLQRWVDTCDSMLGYRTAELEWFGKPAARLDDALHWAPARLTALLLTGAAAPCSLDAAGAWRTAVRDARRTASPNAGWPMAAAAGALGVRLTKRGVYVLNPGARDPVPADVARARRLVCVAGVLALVLVEA